MQFKHWKLSNVGPEKFSLLLGNIVSDSAHYGP